jgi:crotonobetainyl-CoA:carnitine CoA-transferase CaiB-like acyl-CoA transferase
MLSVVGVLAALFHQRRTGEGQELWTSLMDGGTVFSSDTLLDRDGTPAVRPKLDAQQRGFDPRYRLYETNDGWIQVCAVSDDDWVALLGATGVPDDESHSMVEPLLEKAFMTRTAYMWSKTLDDAGVPNEVAVEVRNGEGVLFDADNERLGLTTEYLHPIMGLMRQFGNTIDFSETPTRPQGPPPRVGENTREILEELGVSAGEHDALKAAGIVYWPDEHYTWGW